MSKQITAQEFLKPLAGTRYTEAAAVGIADSLQSGDDEWRYEIVPAGDGLYRIAVIDEEGVFVAYWKDLH